MTNWRDKKARRDQLKGLYSGLYEEVSAILFRHDPVGLNFGYNTDEYEPEVDTILPRLEGADSAEDVRRVVHEEFLRWFGTHGEPEPSEETHKLVGREEHYQAIAEDIWDAIVRHGLRRHDDYDA